MAYYDENNFPLQFKVFGEIISIDKDWIMFCKSLNGKFQINVNYRVINKLIIMLIMVGLFAAEKAEEWRAKLLQIEAVEE